MPAEYRIYRQATIPDDERTSVEYALVPVASMLGNSAEQALRAWLKLHSAPIEDGDTYTVIPDTHVHEFTPTVEMQPRLSFS